MSLTHQKQQHHINQLLSTAAGGTGVVGDVDALLTPIGMSTGTMLRTEPKAERNLWREEEMLQMLHLMLKANAIEMLNDKSVKSEKVFRNIEKLMFDSGYRKKSFNQIWTKWKFLKSTYMTSRRAGIVPKMIPPSIYNVLDTILRNASNVSGCGGNSNGGGGSSLDGYNSDSGRMVISHVETENLSNGFSRSGKKQSNDKEDAGSHKDTGDDSYGMAHPIFGFRLGIVKPEPIDTGYDTSPVNDTASGNYDPLENNNTSLVSSSSPNESFQTEIKEEAEDIEINNRIRKPDAALRVTPAPGSITPHQRASTPLATFSQRDSQMPPLRIAPFAKASKFNVQRPQQPMRSPPPLSLRPTTQQQNPQQTQQTQQQQHQQTHRHFTRNSQGQIQSNNDISSSAGNNNVRLRMLLPKPVHQQQQHRIISTSSSGTQIRLPREITIHTTQRPSASATLPRIKHLVRQQPFEAQQIESVLPDLDTDIILQQQKNQQLAMNFDPSIDGPCTSHYSKLKNRKRRLKLPPLDAKSAKVLKTYSSMKAERSYLNSDCYSKLKSNLNGIDIKRINQDEMASSLGGQSKKQNLEKINMHKMQILFEQQQRKAHKKKDEDYFDGALKDLGKSLRLVQRQIINEFFDKQMEMARKEQEFQAQQDKLLIEAFEQQTQLIMRSAQSLLGMDLPGLKEQKRRNEKNEKQVIKDTTHVQEQKVNGQNENHEEEEEEREEEEEDEEDEEEESIEPYYQQEISGDEDNGAEENTMDDNDSASRGNGDDDNGEEEDDTDDEEEEDQQEDYLDENEEAANDTAEQDENESEDSNLSADPIELVSSELVEET